MGKEFYTYDGKIFQIDCNGTTEITEKSHDLIDSLLDDVENLYPDAYKALEKCYEKSKLNQSYFRFLMARRFIKCNFGNLDSTKADIESDGVFNFEKIECPMRGECFFEGVICSPKFNSRLSGAELRVMRLYYGNESIDRIADQLYLSGHTVKNHIKAAYAKLGLHSQAEFISYANKHHLFD